LDLGFGHHLLLDIFVKLIGNLLPIFKGVVDVCIEGSGEVGKPEGNDNYDEVESEGNDNYDEVEVLLQTCTAAAGPGKTGKTGRLQCRRPPADRREPEQGNWAVVLLCKVDILDDGVYLY
jgi:hypothetical protein